MLLHIRLFMEMQQYNQICPKIGKSIIRIFYIIYKLLKML